MHLALLFCAQGRRSERTLLAQTEGANAVRHPARMPTAGASAKNMKSMIGREGPPNADLAAGADADRTVDDPQQDVAEGAENLSQIEIESLSQIETENLSQRMKQLKAQSLPTGLRNRKS